MLANDADILFCRSYSRYNKNIFITNMGIGSVFLTPPKATPGWDEDVAPLADQPEVVHRARREGDVTPLHTSPPSLSTMERPCSSAQSFIKGDII